MSPTRKQAEAFVSSLLEAAMAKKYDPSTWIIDHICYRTSTYEEYHQVLEQLAVPSSDLAGMVLSTAMVNGRPITSLRLNEPLSVDGKLIEVLEIPAPKSSQSYSSGFEHAEVLALEPVKENEVMLMPGKVKFHYLPLSGLIAVEEKPGLGDWITKHRLTDLLSAWDPLFSGSIPIGVDTRDSDLDILLYGKDLFVAANEILRTLHGAGITTSGEWKLGQCRQGACMTLCINTGTTPIELFLATEHPSRQDSHRDLVAEYLLLIQHGDSLREKVRALKETGIDTETAFARALQLPSDWHRKWQVEHHLKSSVHQSRPTSSD